MRFEFSIYNVDTVFAGHLHNNVPGKYGTMEMVNSSAVGGRPGMEEAAMFFLAASFDRSNYD